MTNPLSQPVSDHVDTGLRLASDVAIDWYLWCGETAWVTELRRFGTLGGQVKWWCGYPQSKSAIPLCFVLYDKDGVKVSENRSRLKDIRQAVEILEVQACHNT